MIEKIMFKIINFIGKLKFIIFLVSMYHSINKRIWLNTVIIQDHINEYIGINTIFQIILKIATYILIFNNFDSLFDDINV